MGKMTIWYDEEGDYLELSIEPKRKGYFRDIGNDVWERVDGKGNIIGIAIQNFKERFAMRKTPVKLPLNMVFVHES